MKATDPLPPKHPLLRRMAYGFAFLGGAATGLGMLGEGWDRHRFAQFDLERARDSIEAAHRTDQASHDAQLRKYGEMLPALLRQLPETWPAAAIEQEIRTLAKNHGIDSPPLSAAAENRYEFWAEKHYTLELTGSSDELLAFAADLYRGDTPLRTLDLSVRATNFADKAPVAKLYATYYRWLTQEEFNAKAKLGQSAASR